MSPGQQSGDTKEQGAFAATLSWPALERRIQAGAIAVLPVGAACKAHGPHLPMNTDFLQAEWLAAALVRRAGVLVWPTISYGYYPAFIDYPGSVSLACETFQALVQHILSDIHRAGARAVLILNTGISTIEPLKAAMSAMPRELPVRLANVYYGARYRKVAEEIEEQVGGGHADELETSILLVIGREHVVLERAEAWTPASMAESGPFSRGEPDNPRYSPGGVWGDPTRATEEKGRRLLAAMVDDLVAAIGELQQSADNGQEA